MIVNTQAQPTTIKEQLESIHAWARLKQGRISELAGKCVESHGNDLQKSHVYFLLNGRIQRPEKKSALSQHVVHHAKDMGWNPEQTPNYLDQWAQTERNKPFSPQQILLKALCTVAKKKKLMPVNFHKGSNLPKATVCDIFAGRPKTLQPKTCKRLIARIQEMNLHHDVAREVGGIERALTLRPHNAHPEPSPQTPLLGVAAVKEFACQNG